MNEYLKPCSFCGGTVTVAITGDNERQNYFITRGNEKDKCTCRVFMESEDFYADEDNKTRLKIKNKLIERWNNRT